LIKKFLSKITIYDKYIFTQVLATTLVAILLFTVIWIAPEMLLNTIKKVLAGELTLKMAFFVLFYELPKILGKALPVGLLLGSLFTFDKLSKDSELTIFRAVGLSFGRIMAPVFVLSLIVTLLCFVTYDKLIPISVNELKEIKRDNEVSQYIYTQKDEHNKPTLGVVISKFDNNTMSNIVVLDFQKKDYEDLHGLNQIYVAKSAKKFDNRWELYDVTKYLISSDGIFETIEHVDKKEILRGVDAQNAYKLMTYSIKRDREIENGDLHNYVKLLKQEDLNEEYRLMLNKYFQRFFHPFVCVLMAVLGCLLGFSKPREQRLVGFTIAIGSIFLYYITLPFFDLLAEKGILHPLLTAAFPPIAFLIAIWVFYKSKDL
jgi:lipopolysaccharide export system permease protein